MNEKNIEKQFFKKVSISPFVNINSTFNIYLFMILALIPQIAMLFITKSFNNLLVILSATLGCLFSEIHNFVKKENIYYSILSNIFTGILIGFFLPESYPVISVFFITLFVMITVKYIFGNLNVSWINPVVITVAVCWFIGQLFFPDFLITKDFLTVKNPSLLLIQNGIFETFSFDESLTSFLNDNIFGHFGISIPQGYVSLFWDSGSVIPAFRFNFLTLIFSIILITFGFISAEIPFFFLITYLVLVKFFSPVIGDFTFLQGDMLLALLTSGTIFCTFFLLQFLGTTPLSKFGKIVYGLFGGILAFIFCGVGTSPIGAIITVLFLNIFSPVIQYFENKKNRSQLINLMRKENA